MVRAAVIVVLLAAAGWASVSPVLAAQQRVTVVGDSVPAALSYVPSAERYLSRGLRVRFDLRVCRRLVAASCTYQGSTPTTALESIVASGSSLGQTAVIDVGYNDAPSSYAHDLDTVMRALVKRHVTLVVWVTMKEARTDYQEINGVIRHATGRWPQLRVADWNAASRGRPWFAGDGLHLNPAGAWGLAHLIRQNLVAG